MLFINTVYSHISNQKHVDQVLEETKQISAQQIEGNKAVIEDSLHRGADIKVSNQSSLEDADEAISYEFDLISPVNSISDAPLNTNLVIGQLYLPESEINVPILEGISKDNLNNGASTLKPNQKLGKENYALASFNVNEKAFLFSNLSQVEENQTVYLSDKEMVYEYEVSNVYRSEDTIKSLSSDDKGAVLTLVTHNTESDAYSVVQADYKVSYSIKDSTKDIKEIFLPE